MTSLELFGEEDINIQIEREAQQDFEEWQTHQFDWQY